MQLTCPCCHARFPVESATEDDAARAFFGVLARTPALYGAMVAYLGLFRSQSRALGWGRAYKLAQEVIALGTGQAMVQALAETVESLREKQQQPGWKPLSGHNYLKKVLDSVEARGIQPERLPQEAPVRTLKTQTGQALARLQALKTGGQP
ncbi:hypothetical protein GCM10023116_31010 [Kistimonas scapharcae]|uniref:DUF2225 domain-containing protein n=1 Tax=Kistimonas scapharcae TaxID=1036133 RepID=A0ABP8V3L8_9GAMM